MLKNYFKVTFRNLRKNKWFSLINIIGLTIGITGSLIIYLYIDHELSFDDFHSDTDRIYRITRSSDTPTIIDYEANVPYPMIKSLHQDFTQFESVTLYHSDDEPTVVVDDKKFKLKNQIFADSNFFEIFSFEIIEGNPKVALSQPNFVFLSKTTADKFYGSENPIGKKISVNGQLELEVAGIFADLPSNSLFNFEAVVSFPTFSSDYLGGLNIDTWQMSAEGYAFVKLKNNISKDQAEKQFPIAMKKYLSDQDYKRKHFHLQPITDIHFDNKWNKAATDMKSLYALGAIGAILLLIGCVNFINLSTAMAVKKSKEVGVRKSLGAGKAQLVAQYLGETFLITSFSGLLAVGISERLVPLFNNAFEMKLEMNIFQGMDMLLFVLFIIIIVTLLAGIYPALVLADYSPIKALKNNIHSQSNSSLFLRKGLIVTQFIISQILIISTIVIANQMAYFKTKPLGFDKKAIINVSVPDNKSDLLDRFRNQLMADPGIKEVTFSLGPPASTNTFETNYRLSTDSEENRIDIQIQPADRYYKDTYGVQLLYGRWFTEADEKSALVRLGEAEKEGENISFILNETAVKALGFNNPQEAIGTMITSGIGDISAPIIGIVKDFHVTSFREKIRPIAIIPFPMFYYNAGIKISLDQREHTLKHIEEVFNGLYPNSIFDYSFMDDDIMKFYVKEQRSYNMLKVFSGLSIFISCLGLLGMISFIVTQRSKEVSIRKVLGANMLNVVVLFTKDFIVLVLIAFLLAAPIAWYLMKIWLADFAYRIDFHVWFFALAMLISVVITFITIGYQSLQAALENPVNSLKNE
ncbi:MAG TPA: ABC transporter permease [Fulvivirga sp.]|nr:ABC transporter permease [Fulvivirga sp.]